MAAAVLPACVLADSVSALGADAVDVVIVTGSHGGRVAGAMAIRAGVHAAIFNDAGIGLRGAGIAGLSLFEQCGLAAAAVDCHSARIGEAASTLRGRISVVNAVGETLGVRPGMVASDAACLIAGTFSGTNDIAIPEERRVRLDDLRPDVLLLDSASMVGKSDAGAIVVTGSHGGMVGGASGYAIKLPVRAAVFNDAGMGMGRAGTARLAALDAMGIPAATVSAASAAIGDARSTYDEGRLSAVNHEAALIGAAPGMDCADFVALARDALRRT